MALYLVRPCSTPDPWCQHPLHRFLHRGYPYQTMPRRARRLTTSQAAANQLATACLANTNWPRGQPRVMHAPGGRKWTRQCLAKKSVMPPQSQAEILIHLSVDKLGLFITNQAASQKMWANHPPYAAAICISGRGWRRSPHSATAHSRQFRETPARTFS